MVTLRLLTEHQWFVRILIKDPTSIMEGQGVVVHEAYHKLESLTFALQKEAFWPHVFMQIIEHWVCLFS